MCTNITVDTSALGDEPQSRAASAAVDAIKKVLDAAEDCLVSTNTEEDEEKSDELLYSCMSQD